MHSFPILLWFTMYIPECKQQLKTIKYYTHIQDMVHFKSGLSFCYSQRDLDVILHGFMLQIIYTTVFENVV